VTKSQDIYLPSLDGRGHSEGEKTYITPTLALPHRWGGIINYLIAKLREITI